MLILGSFTHTVDVGRKRVVLPTAWKMPIQRLCDRTLTPQQDSSIQPLTCFAFRDPRSQHLKVFFDDTYFESILEHSVGSSDSTLLYALTEKFDSKSLDLDPRAAKSLQLALSIQELEHLFNVEDPADKSVDKSVVIIGKGYHLEIWQAACWNKHIEACRAAQEEINTLQSIDQKYLADKLKSTKNLAVSNTQAS